MGLEANKAEIHKAFTLYVKHATEVLQQHLSLKKKMAADSLKLAYIDPGLRLRALVDQIEKSREFTKLSSALDSASAHQSQQNLSGGTQHGLTYSYSIYLKNFFRRSRFYLTAFKVEQEEPDGLFNLFWSVIFHREVKTTTLRIIDEFSFESQHVDCGPFRIHRLTKKELDVLSDREVNEIFYPYARLDTDVVSQYWLLIEERFTNRGLNVETSVSESVRDELIESLSMVRQVPDRTIQLLAIHDWAPDFTVEELQEMATTEAQVQAFSRFAVPFRFTINDDVLGSPNRIGDMPVLRGLDEWIPVVSHPQENQLRRIVESGQKLLEIVHRVKPNWDFVEVAMGYLGKSFLTDLNEDQILWNVAAIEALLGEKGEVTQSMKRRLGNILGATKQEKKEIRKAFDELYDFRSDLVHGNTFAKKAGHHHLGKAREFARRVMIWFLDYLLWVDEDFHQRGIPYEHYPRRSELLWPLDFNQPSLNRVSLLIQRLPTGFPTLNK